MMVSTAGRNAPGASALTAAELYVLPLLSTHLTFKEIGGRIYLSRHTVKSHSVSIYRKLGVTSRAAAVDGPATSGCCEQLHPLCAMPIGHGRAGPRTSRRATRLRAA